MSDFSDEGALPRQQQQRRAAKKAAEAAEAAAVADGNAPSTELNAARRNDASTSFAAAVAALPLSSAGKLSKKKLVKMKTKYNQRGEWRSLLN